MSVAAQRPPASVVEDTAPVKLLVVDDRPEDRQAMAAILKSPEYRIVEAASGREALRRLLDGDFAAVLLDIKLPDMDGFEVATAIKTRGRAATLPILFLTAETTDADFAQRAYRLGAADYLSKPLVPEAVRSKVGVFAELHRQRKRIEQQAARLVGAQRSENELRVAELQLRSERRYRTLADAVPHIVWTARPDGTVDYFNRRWFEATGISAIDARGSWFEAVHPDDRERCASAWRDALSSGARFEVECRLRGRSEGQYRWHLARALPERAASGEIAAWLGTFTDVEDQRRAAEVLAELKGTLDAVHDAVVIFEADTLRFLYVNDGAAQLFGRPPEELLQAKPTELFTDCDEPAMRDLLAKLRERGEKRALVETRGRRKDGQETPVEASFQLIRVDGGRIVAIARDITGRKLAELEREHLYQEAVAAVRARDEFLTVASHELRGPLSALQLRLETLRRTSDPKAPEPTPPEQVHDRVCAASRQAERLARLVAELLDVTRITAGKLELEPRPTDLAHLARDVVGRFQEEAEKVRSPIEVHAEAPVEGHWDSLRMEQVLTNLVSNALKFGAGKPVDVTVRAAGPRACVMVRDRGMGVAQEDRDRIFHRFERTAAAGRYSGLGMGLYITRQIVEAHGGTVRVDGDVGVGSTFIVDVPKESQPPSKPPAR